jgi:hypothetical protein
VVWGCHIARFCAAPCAAAPVVVAPEGQEKGNALMSTTFRSLD